MQLRIYLPWIGIPLVLLVAGIRFHPEPGAARSDLPRQALTGKDRGRSALRFHALTRSGLDEKPVYTVNCQGLSIDISIDPETYQHMLLPGSRFSYKRRATNVAVSFGGMKACPAVLHTRGSSTLQRANRLNFSIKLLQPMMITTDIEIERLYLMNMLDDPHQFELAFAYDLLQDLGFFPPHHQFARVLVNGEPRGMFMLVERPRDAIRRVHRGTVSVTRRGKADLFRGRWSKSVPFAGRQIKRFTQVIHEGTDDNIAALEEVIDLEAYLTWMALNSILKNADTADELFLYEVRKDRNRPEPLRFMAWDYDEILVEPVEPHTYTDPLLYASLPSLLDFLIRKDDSLYERYRSTVRRLLTKDLPVEYLLRRIRRTVALRDGLDDGLPPEQQEQQRLERMAAVEAFEQALKERHALLIERLEAGD